MHCPIVGLPAAQSWGRLKSHCWITSCTIMGPVKVPLLDYLLHNHGASYNPIAGLPAAQSWGRLKSHCWITSCTLKEPVILWPGQKPLLGSSHIAHSDLESDFRWMERVQLQSDCTWWPRIRPQMNGKSSAPVRRHMVTWNQTSNEWKKLGVIITSVSNVYHT